MRKKYYPDIVGGKYIAVAVKVGEARSFVLTAYLTKSIRTGGSTMTTLQYCFDKEADVLKRAERELPAVILPFRAELTVVR